jgi:uncharacterized protein (TIGR00251 family)
LAAPAAEHGRSTLALPPPRADAQGPWPCLSGRASGALLSVAVVPNAKRTEVDGLHDGALRVRLAALPIEGRANDALVAWLAKALGVPRRDVRIAHGATARRKLVAIDLAPEAVAAWLEHVLPAPD